MRLRIRKYSGILGTLKWIRGDNKWTKCHGLWEDSCFCRKTLLRTAGGMHHTNKQPYLRSCTVTRSAGVRADIRASSFLYLWFGIEPVIFNDVQNKVVLLEWIYVHKLCAGGDRWECDGFLELTRNFNRLDSSGHYMYRQFNIQQFYVLPTQCIYVFCVDLRTNSNYFPTQH